MKDSLTVETQVLGARRPLPAWRVAYPEEWQVAGETMPLRQLIARIVTEEVLAFNERQETRQLAHALSLHEITRAAAKGKIDMGGRPATKADAGESVRIALQAFEDGMYLVFVDGEQVTSLDAPVLVHAESRLRFVRLVMLAGG